MTREDKSGVPDLKQDADLIVTRGEIETRRRDATRLIARALATIDEPFCECPPDGTRRWDGAGRCHACGRAYEQGAVRP